MDDSPGGANRAVRCIGISEENTMAILDASGVRDARDVKDDKLSFLEAVRAASIVSELGAVPTRQMFEAVFQILKDGTYLELTMESYQLLSDLEKCFPRLKLVTSKKPMSSSSTTVELNVLTEVWSPFLVGSENSSCERDATSRNLSNAVDSFAFFTLTHDIAQSFNNMDSKRAGTRTLGHMLLFQYLVSVLEGDFLPRYTVYKETMDWTLLRECLLNLLLGSRKINFKSLIRDCLSILSKRSHHNAGFSLCNVQNAENASTKTLHDCDVAVIELGKGTCIAVQKFLTLIMELDMVKKEAEIQWFTSRADGLRTPLVEIILDELTYNKSLLSPFLQVFSESRWKLEIILQYFWKYCTQFSVRTRSSNNSSEDATFDSFLKCFSNATSTRNVVRKLNIEVAQLLLGHAFQAYLFMQQGPKKHLTLFGDDSLVQKCKNMISAFSNLNRIDDTRGQVMLVTCVRAKSQCLFRFSLPSSVAVVKFKAIHEGNSKGNSFKRILTHCIVDMEILPFAKEALFTAATILSVKS